MKYRSPGLESDILRGNFLPQGAATSRIIAYLSCYVKTELYPNPVHMLDYSNIYIGKSQRFCEKKFVKNADFFRTFFGHKFLCFIPFPAQNIEHTPDRVWLMFCYIL